MDQQQEEIEQINLIQKQNNIKVYAIILVIAFITATIGFVIVMNTQKHTNNQPEARKRNRQSYIYPTSQYISPTPASELEELDQIEIIDDESDFTIIEKEVDQL